MFLGKNVPLGSELKKCPSRSSRGDKVQDMSEWVSTHFLEVILLPDVKFFLIHSVERQ